MGSKLELENFRKYKKAREDKVSYSAIAYKKKEEEFNLTPSLYWNFIDREAYNLENLLSKENLEEIYRDYEVDPMDLIMVYYGKFKTYPETFAEKHFNLRYTDKEIKQMHENWKEKDEIDYYSQYKEAQSWLNKKPLASKGKKEKNKEKEKNKHYKTSPIQITKGTVEAPIQIKVRNTKKNELELQNVYINNGVDIFLKCIVSENVPFVSYCSPSSSLSVKAFDGHLPFTIDRLKPSDTLLLEPNTIQMVVFSSVSREGYIAIENYIHVIISLEKRKITAVTKLDEGKTYLFERVQEHSPIIIGEMKETNILGEFTIFGIKLNLSLFMDFIMLNPIARKMIYLNESSSALSFKKRMNFHITEPIGEEKNILFSFLLHEEQMSKTENNLPIVDYLNNNDNSNNNKGVISAPKGMWNLKILINKSYSRENLHFGLITLLLLLSLYKEEENSLIEDYSQYGINFSKEFLKEWSLPITGVGNKVFTDKDEYINDLQSAAPHIFVKGYASTCQLHHQPVIIPPKLISKWNREHEANRRAIGFPPREEELFIGCENSEEGEARYVAMKESKLKNKKEYPYLPCCTLRNTQEEGSNSLFTQYYLGEERERDNDEGKIQGGLTSKKLLKFKQFGEVLPLIHSIFRVFGYDVKRQGVPLSPLSAILCADFATSTLNEKNRRKKKGWMGREEGWEDRIRQKLIFSNKIRPEVMLQELYDYTHDEILVKIQGEFFDTFDMVRWLEERYKLHIFVFSVSREKEIVMEIPRHKYFPIRPYLGRKCLVLQKHWGSGLTTGQKYPQYELIRTDEFTVWPEAVSQKLLKMFYKQQEVYQIEMRRPQNIHSNPYSTYSILDVFPMAEKQYVDDAGKLRGIIISIGEGKDDKMTIYVPPSQPLNLPREEEVEFSIETEVVLSYFEDKPSNYSKEGDWITGLWFPFNGIEEGVYVPIVEISMEDFEEFDPFNGDIEKEKGAPVGRPNPFYTFGKSILEVYHNMDKMRRIYLQTLLWVFLLYSTSLSPSPSKGEKGEGEEIGFVYKEENIKPFANKYMKVGKFDPSTSLAKINTTLPNTRDAEEALQYLSDHFPFVKKNKFLTLNRDMYEKLIYFLKFSVEKHRYPSSDLTTLNYLYSSSDDFPKTNEMQVFLSLEDFKVWSFIQKQGEGDKMRIVTSLSLDLANVRNPFVYKSKENHFFLIQNVSLGDKKRALKNASEYKEKGVNLGYFTPPIEENVQHNTYFISPEGALFTPSPPHPTRPISILEYDEHIYAALIEIL